MFPAFRTCVFLTASSLVPALAGTVVVTSLPDETHPLAPLTSAPGAALSGDVQVSIGAFPGMTDDQILDAAASGGLPQIITAFQTFDTSKAIGDGVDEAAGAFEIAVRQSTAGPASPFVGQEVALLIKKDEGQEFLVARFKGKFFEADPDTGLEPQLSLHLADAKLIVGNRRGPGKISTSSAPQTGSYQSWSESYPSLATGDKGLPDADPDGDGRNNFLEYATGGDPESPSDLPPCQMVADESGDLWIRFSQTTGNGNVTPTIQTASAPGAPWQTIEGAVEPDPQPLPGDGTWMRIRVPTPLQPESFFRLNVEAAD